MNVFAFNLEVVIPLFWPPLLFIRKLPLTNSPMNFQLTKQQFELLTNVYVKSSQRIQKGNLYSQWRFESSGLPRGDGSISPPTHTTLQRRFPLRATVTPTTTA